MYVKYAALVHTSDATFIKFPNQNQTDTDWMPIWKTKYQTDFIWALKSRHLYQIFKKLIFTHIKVFYKQKIS